MKRRDLLLGALVATGSAGLVPSPGLAQTPRETAVADGPLVVNGLDTSELSRDYVAMQRSVGVDCWHKSMGGLRTYADALNFVDANADIVQVARSVAEIRTAKAQGKLALMFGWQGSEPLSGPREGANDWWSATPHTELRAYYELGLRVAGIAYQIANAFGGGGLDPTVGLTVAGRRLVEEIHKLRIVLDVGGHTGDQASLDALAMSSGVPIICSHAGARRFANSSRNLSDAVIDGIARTGGVIGIPAINDFVVRGKEMANVEPSPLGGIEDFLKHADYLKSRIGADHVSWGPDFTYGKPNNRDFALFGADVMDHGPRRFLRGFEDVTKLVPTVTKGLKDHGWTEAEVRGFMGGNWIRVYGQVWGA
jgi:membrane dipeptidase